MLKRLLWGAIACTVALVVGFYAAKYATVQAAPKPANFERAPGATPAPIQMAQNTAPAGEAKGAPLGATGAAASKSEASTPAEAPKGASLGATGAADAKPGDAATDPNNDGLMTPSGQPSRVLSQSALDMVKEIDGTPADPLAFEKTQDGQFWKLTFAALGSFRYDVPDPDELRKSATPTKPVKDQIPGKLKEMDGQPVLLVGFMVPIEITREGKVKTFALTQNQQFCCFGVPPAMNEWVMVTMDEGKTADYIMDLPVAAYGKLAVGEEIEDGYVLSMYRMTSSEVITAPELLKRTKKPS